jgi:hypothetical protein
MANLDCTFSNPENVVFQLCDVDYDGDQLAEAIQIPELESIVAESTLSGTSYSAKNAKDYTITVSAVNGSELHKSLEKAFRTRTCCSAGLFDYNANSQFSIISDSVVVLSRGEINFGLSEARSYSLNGRWVYV